MGVDGSGQMGLNCPSSGMNISGECFWDLTVSMSQNPNFGDSSMISAHGAFANLNVAEMVPKFPDFDGGSFSGRINSFGVPSRGQNYTSICPEKYSQLSEETETASPNGKRKRVSDHRSSSNPSKAAEVDIQQDLSGETSEQKGSEEKKQKHENCDGEDMPTGNYVHVRARRGQATNSHSLAERVRREKISERMKALQELVPGCSKITGKAVMLDEIINYVQSLQQQVEFLSMKLATVNPESNFDMSRILSKDILHLGGGGDTLLQGLNQGTSSSHPYALGIHQGALPGMSNTSTYLSLPQGTWDGEIQRLLHMGFNSNPTVANLGPNGIPRSEP